MLWVGDFQVATGGGFWVAIGAKRGEKGKGKREKGKGKRVIH